jgi:hypothetical protein
MHADEKTMQLRCGCKKYFRSPADVYVPALKVYAPKQQAASPHAFFLARTKNEHRERHAAARIKRLRPQLRPPGRSCTVTGESA